MKLPCKLTSSCRLKTKAKQDRLGYTGYIILLKWSCVSHYLRLCVATLKVLRFGSENDAVFAMFDGGHNNEVPKILLDHIPSLLQYELQHERTADKYMKYTMLAAHRWVIYCR